MAEKKQLAKREEARNIVDVVAERVKALVSKGDLVLPPNYSAENALKSAWLILQHTLTKDKKPVLSACTQPSISNSLLDMVVQGLNPAKKQCYFIAYGSQLTCQRSYHGARAVVKNICGAKDVDAQVVWGDDEFEYEIVNGVKRVITHKQKLANVGKDPQGAYCIITFPDGRTYTDIMTMADIKKAWSKSKMDPEKAGSTHQEFQEEMIRKTVINRACKKYINSSSDSALLRQSFNRGDEIADEYEFADEVAENANGEVIDVEPGNVPPPQQEQEQEQQPPKDEFSLAHQQVPEEAVAGGPDF